MHPGQLHTSGYGTQLQICHSVMSLVGCSLTLTLSQGHWNSTSSPILPKNQVNECRATWPRGTRGQLIWGCGQPWRDPAKPRGHGPLVPGTAVGEDPSLGAPCISRQWCCRLGQWPLQLTPGSGALQWTRSCILPSHTKPASLSLLCFTMVHSC